MYNMIRKKCSFKKIDLNKSLIIILLLILIMPVQTRSQTKALCSNQQVKANAKVKKPKPEATIVTLEELQALGLNPWSFVKQKYRIVIHATHLDSVITNRDELKGKYAIAPEGYYWKEFSEKNYYWFDWYELRVIPKVNPPAPPQVIYYTPEVGFK